MRDYPFLLKRFNISYAYSATLFYQTSLTEPAKGAKRGKPSWLAVAPVFADTEGKKATPEAIELQRRMTFYCSDTLSTVERCSMAITFYHSPALRPKPVRYMRSSTLRI
jgi:hypothetical protein